MSSLHSLRLGNTTPPASAQPHGRLRSTLSGPGGAVPARSAGQECHCTQRSAAPRGARFHFRCCHRCCSHWHCCPHWGCWPRWRRSMCGGQAAHSPWPGGWCQRGPQLAEGRAAVGKKGTEVVKQAREGATWAWGDCGHGALRHVCSGLLCQAGFRY